MSIRDAKDLNALRRVGKVVAETLRLMLRGARPGMTTRALDNLGAAFFQKYGARSAPQLTYNFPGATCISVNQEIAHGIPGNRVIRHGDLLNIDVSLELDGYFADTGTSICVGAPDSVDVNGNPVASLPEESVPGPAHASFADAAANEAIAKRMVNFQRLCDASRSILQQTIQNLKAGDPLNQIGKSIEAGARAHGYTTVVNLAGHGVGSSLHEEPFDLVNYYDPRDKRVAKRGQVVAIETFISTGGRFAQEGSDGWTLTTGDGSFVAQHENSIVITNGTPIILTA